VSQSSIVLGQGVFTAQLTAKLAKVSLRQLNYWVAKELLSPSAYDAPRHARDLFTFGDIVQARAIGDLRRQGASLQKVRRAVTWLRDEMALVKWHTKTLFTDGVDVFVLLGPDEAYSAALAPGQRAFTVSLGTLADEITAAGESLGIGRDVVVNPAVQGGLPVLKDTRIPTKLIGQLADEGHAPQEIAALYPGITEAQVRKAIEFEHRLAVA
jgi:uncharacterized protein (DUF433 family)